MLCAERDQIRDRRFVAALDIGAHELPALREAYGVDGRCVGQLRVSSDVFAYLLNLLCKIANEGGGAVGGRVRV